MSFRSSVTKAFLSAVALVGGCDTATLTGAVTLTGRSGRVQRLDPGGATRTVDLPGPSEGIYDTDGHWFLVQNTADAAENLTIRDPANATVGTLTKGQTGLFFGTGTTYVQVFAAGGPTGSTAAGEGASLVGIQDVGTYYTGTEVEAALQEVGPLFADVVAAQGDATQALSDASDAQADVDAYQDQFVNATIAVASTAGGGTDALLTVDLVRAIDNSTVLGSARQVLIVAKTAQYKPYVDAEVGNVEFSGAVTKGSVIATDTGWALVQTDADGEFDMTVANAQDETLYFAVTTPLGVSDKATRCVVVASNSDVATWSA